MKQSAKIWPCVLATFVGCAGAKGLVADSPYGAISSQNIFKLKPTAKPEEVKPAAPPAPKVTLTGITTIFGNKRALFKVQMPPRPPEPAKEQSFILAEGQRDGDVEVLEIDEKNNTVKLDDFGTVMTVNFTDNGAKPSGAPMPGAPPGAPAVGGFVPPPSIPSPAPAPISPAATTIANPALRQIPTRIPRTGTTSGGPAFGSSGVAFGGGSVATPAPMVAAPSFNSTPTPNPQQNYPPERQMTPEEQRILMEVERERNKNNPDYPPLPPTPLTPAGANAGQKAPF